MSAPLVLYPSFGAEDGRLLLTVDPALAGALASTWALGFASTATLYPQQALPRPPWMADARGAALPFWDDAAGFLPWLSTTDAARKAHELGLALYAPPAEVVRALSDKAWALQMARRHGLLPGVLEPLLCALSAEELLAPGARDLVDERLRSWPAWAQERFVLKPRFGSSGRGRVPGREGKLDDAGARGLAKLAKRGGALLEPWLERSEDLSAQLYVDDSGRVTLLGTTRQVTAPSGLWLGNAAVLDDTPHAGSVHDCALAAAALLIGEEAARAGFSGPLGIDAFAFRQPGGAVALRPVVEVNARHTMGLVALSLLARARSAGRAAPGEVGCWRPQGGHEQGAAGVRRLPLPAGTLALASSQGAVLSLSGTAGRPKRR